MSDGPIVEWLFKHWSAFWRWYHRRKLKTESERFVFDSLYKVVVELPRERERAMETQPKVGVFVEMPTSAPWADGLKFDEPDLTLLWTFTKDDFKRDILGGSEGHAGKVVLWGGVELWCSVSYFEAFLWPHIGETISSIYLSGREQPGADIVSDYNRCAEALLGYLGSPTSEKEMPPFYWPAHTRRVWETDALKIWHSITSHREGPPQTRLVVERKFSKEYLEKYPRAGQETKWDI